MSRTGGPRLTFKHPDGRPVKFFIDSLSTKYPSIPDLELHPRFSVQQAARYESFIKKHGGERLRSAERELTDILIVGDAVEEAYTRWFKYDPYPVVVTSKFLKTCLETGKYEHKVPMKKGISGRPARGAVKKWTPFTFEEKQMLCKYISHRIPESEAGGRSGKKIYEELEQHAVDYPSGPWALAKNHPWQSWREHYAKNKDKLDPIIDEMAKAANITSESKGTYAFDRRAILRRGVEEREIESEQEEGEEGGRGEAAEEAEDIGEDEPPAPLVRRRRAQPSNDEDELSPSMEDEDEEPPRAPARKRRRTENNQRRGEPDGEVWSMLEPTLNNSSAPVNDVRPGPEDAGPSGTQRSPAPSPQPASPPPRRQPPKPRPKARRTRAPTPPNTQQTLVDPTSPTKNSRQRQRAGELSGSEDDVGTPEPSQPLSPVPTIDEESTGRSESAVADEIEAFLLSDREASVEVDAEDADVEVDDEAPEGGEVQAVEEDAEDDEGQEDEDVDMNVGSDDERAAASTMAEVGDDDEPFAIDWNSDDEED